MLKLFSLESITFAPMMDIALILILIVLGVYLEYYTRHPKR